MKQQVTRAVGPPRIPPEVAAKLKYYVFTGAVVEKLACKYRGGSVRKYLPPRSQNPVVYANC